MKTSQLKKFAQFARRSLIEQVSAKIKLVLAEDSNARRENPKAVEEIEKAISHQGKAVSNQPSVISKSKETTDDWRLAADGSKTDGLIEKVAYTWFNRFCALRFMDVNRYTRIGVVSPAEGQSQPEILAEAKMGYIDDGMVPEKIRQQIFALLDGSAPSQDPQSEAYRLLVVAICNYWYKAMPFLFERIDDYTELLMPDDLLSGNSILAYMREAISLEAVSNQLSVISKDKNDNLEVEVIGWLYQFYISEKKDEVFAGLKKNRKITPENIPAATQLFTPHWIVRYLVENSVGRLWMLNRPDSKLIEQMDYYIRPETSHQPSVVSNQKDHTDDCKLTADGSASIHAEQDFLKIHSPEEIRICDPACGSGHMLTYAFDLLYSIYEEEGYEPSEIPEKILIHNLYGIEIDERAGELAAFALTMKARSKQRRFLRKKIQPNICVLEKIEEGTTDEHGWTQIIDELSATGVNHEDLIHDLRLFAEVDNFGSLLRPRLEASDFEKLIKTAQQMLQEHLSDTFLNPLIHRCIKALKQADYLSQKYHVVIANPPYMGSKGMNGRLGVWAKENYPDSKLDTFAMFLQRGLDLIQPCGFKAMVTMESWMFLSSFEKLRLKLLSTSTIQSMVHMPYLGKGGTSMGINFGTTAFVTEKRSIPNLKGRFCCVRYYETNDDGVPYEFPPQNERLSSVSSEEIKNIPGSPIAYWVSASLRKVFSRAKPLGEQCDFRIGMATGKNDTYVRQWHEVNNIGIDLSSKSRDDAKKTSLRWFPYAKGGEFRKWRGNEECVVNWENDGLLLQTTKHPTSDRIRAHNFNLQNIFKPAICWTVVTSGRNGFRFHAGGFLFDAAAGLCQPKNNISTHYLLGLLNSKVTETVLPLINPTINLHPGYLSKIPSIEIASYTHVKALTTISKSDWDSYETSWDFAGQPLLQSDYRQFMLKTTYQNLRVHWQEMTLEMQRLEEENNHIFINAYGLQDELTPEVPLKEITLTCNPYYRYGGDKSEEELEALLLADTMREFISYAVGCMFGRYSLDASGLILANQGDGIDDYHRIVQEKRKHPEVFSNQPSVVSKNNKTTDDFTDNCQLNTDGSLSGFQPDKDNVIPILDGDWFTDDITERFFKFLRVTFGEEHYEENLNFIETAIGKSIRNYFLKHFYNDHVKRYKKRPIYWLFSSPKGSFNALIYMHRYRSDTVSVVLNDYLREFRTKLTSRKNQLEALGISASAKKIEKTRALKEIEKNNKMIDELDEYEREVLYPLATEQVEIDLDDGVKINYNKFDKALKKIPGLTAKGN